MLMSHRWRAHHGGDGLLGARVKCEHTCKPVLNTSLSSLTKKGSWSSDATPPSTSSNNFPPPCPSQSLFSYPPACSSLVHDLIQTYKGPVRSVPAIRSTYTRLHPAYILTGILMETGTKVVLDLEQCTNASYVKGRQARIKNKYEKHLKSPTHLKQLHIAEVRRTGFIVTFAVMKHVISQIFNGI